MKIQERDWYWIPADGTSIFARSWRPDRPRGLILLIHGLGEHSGRYESMARFLAHYGWQVDALDLPGHGRSQRSWRMLTSWTALAELVQIFARRQRLERRPLFLYGHSMGAALALQMALDHPERWTGVIASAPPLAVVQKVPIWKRKLATCLRPLMPWLPMANGIDPALLSRDPQVVSAYRADPLVTDRVPLGLGLALLGLGQQLLPRAGQLKLPLLMMHGSADQIAGFEASHAFCQQAGEHCHWQPWEGAFHELQHEPNWRQVAAILAGWLDDQESSRSHTVSD